MRVLNSVWYYPLLTLVGAASALAMPPYDQWWILAPVFSFFIFAEVRRNSKSFRSRYVAGWFLGFGYFLATLQWISNAFLVDAQNDLWMMPFALGGLAALLEVLSRDVRWGDQL